MPSFTKESKRQMRCRCLYSRLKSWMPPSMNVNSKFYRCLSFTLCAALQHPEEQPCLYSELLEKPRSSVPSPTSDRWKTPKKMFFPLHPLIYISEPHKSTVSMVMLLQWYNCDSHLVSYNDLRCWTITWDMKISWPPHPIVFQKEQGSYQNMEDDFKYGNSYPGSLGPWEMECVLWPFPHFLLTSVGNY